MVKYYLAFRWSWTGKPLPELKKAEETTKAGFRLQQVIESNDDGLMIKTSANTNVEV